MTLSYISKKKFGSITETTNACLSKSEKAMLLDLDTQYQQQLTDIINRLTKNTLIGRDGGNQTVMAIDNLKTELSTHISVLFRSECDSVDRSVFQAKFKKSLVKLENTFVLVNDGETSAIEAAYTKFVKPMLMAMMGIIVGIVISPALPFSSSARDYVGSFFKSSLGNTLHNEFKNFCSSIDENAVSREIALNQIDQEYATNLF